jgi:hypothetical protein
MAAKFATGPEWVEHCHWRRLNRFSELSAFPTSSIQLRPSGKRQLRTLVLQSRKLPSARPASGFRHVD